MDKPQKYCHNVPLWYLKSGIITTAEYFTLWCLYQMSRQCETYLRSARILPDHSKSCKDLPKSKKQPGSPCYSSYGLRDTFCRLTWVVMDARQTQMRMSPSRFLYPYFPGIESSQCYWWVVLGRPCLRRSQVLGILNKELDRDRNYKAAAKFH